MNNQWRGCATEGTERVTHGNIEIFAGFADGRGFSDHPAPGFLRTGPRFPGCLPGTSRSGLWISGFAPCAATRAHARTGARLEHERIMRSEDRRVGKEYVSTCRSPWLLYNLLTNNIQTDNGQTNYYNISNY